MQLRAVGHFKGFSSVHFAVLRRGIHQGSSGLTVSWLLFYFSPLLVVDQSVDLQLIKCFFQELCCSGRSIQQNKFRKPFLC